MILRVQWIGSPWENFLIVFLLGFNCVFEITWEKDILLLFLKINREKENLLISILPALMQVLIIRKVSVDSNASEDAYRSKIRRFDLEFLMNEQFLRKE